MRVVFRTDSSLEIGTGHVMRCLTLADALLERGAKCSFVCRELEGNLIDFIEQRGYRVTSLKRPTNVEIERGTDAPFHAHWLSVYWQTDAAQTHDAIGGAPLDWIVVDHYALDERWEKQLRASCKKILVIDDLADRTHDCDVLIDQNLGRETQDYCGLLPNSPILLTGPEYSILRPQFHEHRSQSLARRPATAIRHILVLMGGSDKENYTGRVLEVLRQCKLPKDLKISVVMGKHAPFLEDVRAQAPLMQVQTEILVGVAEMASLMASVDLAIGAAGGTSWERCALGVPSLVFVLAANQKEGAKALASAGAAKVMYDPSDLASESCLGDIDALLEELAPMSVAAARVTDGMGVYRVAEAMVIEHV